MSYSMDERVERSEDVFWLKSILIDDSLKERDLLSFRGAEFEFATCPAYTESVAAAAMRGCFGFNVMGQTYRKAVCWWMENVRRDPIGEDWILPTQGTIFSLATTIRLTTQPGEGIIVLTPGYNRYEQAARRLGRKTVLVPMKEENSIYSIDFERLEEAMKDETCHLLAFCNPNNPTGTIYGEEDLKRIAALAEQYNMTVFCDEIFADVALTERQVPIYAKLAGEKAKAVSCTGMGKLFSLTGVNMANCLIANPELREAYKAQRDADHYGSLDPMAASGLVGAFNEKGKAWLEELENYIRGNYELIRDFMKEYLPEVRVTEPQAGYVCWIDYSALGLSRAELHRLLVTEGGFDGDEGEEYYGPDGYYRYCLALPRPDVVRCLEELKKAILKRK